MLHLKQYSRLLNINILNVTSFLLQLLQAVNFLLSNIKEWLQSNIDAELHDHDLVLDNKDLLFFIDKWEKQNETI